MKLFTLLLSLFLSFNIFASTSNLENLINEHQYFLTVEWDQKDKELYEQKSREFGKNFNEIISKGISRNEINNVFQSHIKDPKAVARLNVRLALLPAEPSADDMRELFEETKKDFYAKGASWSGDIDWEAVAWIVGITLFLAASAWYGYSQRIDMCEISPKSYGCEGYEDPGTYYCTSWGSEWRCTTTTSTDYLGNPTSTQVCGSYEVCKSGYYKKD